MKLLIAALCLPLALAWINTKRESLGLAPLQAQKQKQGSKVNKFVEIAQQQWQEESEQLRQFEQSVVSDPDLSELVEGRQKAPNPAFVDKEKHRHDSLAHEVVHALETDPDLAAIFVDDNSHAEHKVNADFRQQEEHRHDSFWDDVQHSIDSDKEL